MIGASVMKELKSLSHAQDFTYRKFHKMLLHRHFEALLMAAGLLTVT